jgi:hypothetical protein
VSHASQVRMACIEAAALDMILGRRLAEFPERRKR